MSKQFPLGDGSMKEHEHYLYSSDLDKKERKGLPGNRGLGTSKERGRKRVPLEGRPVMMIPLEYSELIFD